MKIVQLLCSEGFGGLERHTTDLASALAAKGHEVVLVSSPDHAARLQNGARLRKIDAKAARYNPWALFKIWWALWREKPDVVHAQGNKAAEMLALLRFFLKAKTVGTVHGLKRNVKAFTKLDAAIAVSRGAARRFPDPERVQVISNGVEPYQGMLRLGFVVREEIGVPPAMPLVLAVGRLVPVKAFDVLIEAFAAVRGFLVIAGEGPEREKLQAMIEAKGLGGKIRLLGHRADIPDLMEAADLVVISSHREGFSYVMAESLMMGRPIVATRVPGVEDRVPEAFLVETGDAKALGRVMSEVLADLPQTRATFAPVWEKAAVDLTLENMVNETERVYNELIV